MNTASGNGQSRCVSSFVKKVRLAESTSETKLLTDIILAQAAPKEQRFWDSKGPHNYPQRFTKKKHFVAFMTNSK